MQRSFSFRTIAVVATDDDDGDDDVFVVAVTVAARFKVSLYVVDCVVHTYNLPIVQVFTLFAFAKRTHTHISFTSSENERF